MKHWMRNLAAALMIAAAAWLPCAGLPVFAKTAPAQAVQIVLDPDDPINDIPVDDLPAPEGTLDGMPQQPLEDILTEYTPENMDDRQKVADTTVFPYSAICKLHMYFYDEATQETKHFIGSGFLITPTTVLTCAHCVYDVEHNYKDVRRVIVSPGCTNTSDPYGMHDSANGEVTKILYEPGYEKQGSSSLDCALIQLSTPVGDQAGYIRLSTGAMSSDQLQISGYPAEVRGTVDDDNQYHAWGAPIQSFSRRIDFSIAASGGQSGSPVLTRANEAAAIFAYGYDGYPVNGGTLIDSARVEFIAENSDMAKPVYRAYNPNSGEHFYTMDYEELLSICSMGWQDEGLAWRSEDAQNGLPVYRVYDSSRGDHHYTTSEKEKNYLVGIGWQNEGVAWYAPQDNGYCHIYRLYNPNEETGQHHFTRDEKEKNYLASIGWRYEGIPFNAE